MIGGKWKTDTTLQQFIVGFRFVTKYPANMTIQACYHYIFLKFEFPVTGGILLPESYEF